MNCFDRADKLIWQRGWQHLANFAEPPHLVQRARFVRWPVSASV
jgi:hypothetical protein